MSQGARVVHQTRSRKTRDKLLIALEKLLKEKDFADIGVSEIAGLAGVSPATIYRRFNKKEGFIPVLFDLYVERLNDWMTSPQAQINLEEAGLRAAMHQIAKVAWAQLQEQAHILRAIYLHGRNHLDLLSAQGDHFEAAMLQATKAIIAHYQSEVAHADHDTAARMLAYYFNTILIERGLFRKKSGSWTDDLSDEIFVSQVGEFAFSYLTVDR